MSTPLDTKISAMLYRTSARLSRATCTACDGGGRDVVYGNPNNPSDRGYSTECQHCGGTGYEPLTDSEEDDNG